MKKTITIALIICIAVACHRKAVPASDTASSSKNPPAMVDAPKSDVPVSKAPAADAAHADLVAQGKTVYTARCGRCHGLKDTQAYTTQRWEGILKSMIPKAGLNTTEAQQVTAYVMDNAKK